MASLIDGRVSSQYGRAMFIEALYEESHSPDFENLSVAERQSRLTDVLQQWKRFDDQHEKCLTAKDPVILESNAMRAKFVRPITYQYHKIANPNHCLMSIPIRIALGFIPSILLANRV